MKIFSFCSRAFPVQSARMLSQKRRLKETEDIVKMLGPQVGVFYLQKTISIRYLIDINILQNCLYIGLSICPQGSLVIVYSAGIDLCVL